MFYFTIINKAGVFDGLRYAGEIDGKVDQSELVPFYMRKFGTDSDFSFYFKMLLLQYQQYTGKRRWKGGWYGEVRKRKVGKRKQSS